MTDDFLRNKYLRLKHDLDTNKTGSMKCFGSSMLPILPTASTCHYEVRDEYFVGDIVFAKVKGHWIDSHLVTGKCVQRNRIKYRISNNHGHDNGWTYQVFGKVVKSVSDNGTVKHFK